MVRILHRNRNNIIPADTKTLIIGTFNPDIVENSADFFYGRIKNHLWKLLPLSFGRESLKEKSYEEKVEFIRKFKINFIDLISEIEIENHQNYKDENLDLHVSKWNEIISLMENLPNLKRVVFTRRSFSGIPNIKRKINEVENYCLRRNINFDYVITPARIYSLDKQSEWKRIFNPEPEN